MLLVTTCCICKSASYIYLFNNCKEKCASSTWPRVLTLFDIEREGGHYGSQNVFHHCAQTRRGRKLKLDDLILIYVVSKKVIFDSLGYMVLPWQMVLEIFWSYRSIPKSTSKYQISAKLVTGVESYEHLTFRPTHWLKYRLWRHNDVIVVTSHFFVSTV